METISQSIIMFGLYRLVLALAVAFSHVGLVIHGFNCGQWAVIGFYLLSGFLMERQFHKLAPRGGIGGFYLDRFLRIYPLYFVVLMLGVWAAPVSWHVLAVNLTLLPLNYSFFTGMPMVVVPAWSLACEVHFYLLVPLLAVMSTASLRILAALSLLLFGVSVFLPGAVYWTYIGLPGVLFVFVSGMLINRRDLAGLRGLYGVVAALAVVFICSKYFAWGWKTGININVCVGYLLAVPAMFLLSPLSPRVWWDQTLGLLSYPLFLVHMQVLAWVEGNLRDWTPWTFVGLSLLAAGVLVILVEKPFDLIRYRARGTFVPPVSR